MQKTHHIPCSFWSSIKQMMWNEIWFCFVLVKHIIMFEENDGRHGIENWAFKRWSSWINKQKNWLHHHYQSTTKTTKAKSSSSSIIKCDRRFERLTIDAGIFFFHHLIYAGVILFTLYQGFESWKMKLLGFFLHIRSLLLKKAPLCWKLKIFCLLLSLWKKRKS